jgi:glycosyltransferase involved in cell wall biosynthesis
MRIVFSTEWFSEGMGYSENILPVVMARMGHEVFVVSSTMQVYGDHEFYPEVYERFLGPSMVEPGTKVINGVTVIRLPILIWWKRLKIVRARTRTVLGLKPDIVFSWDPRSIQTVLHSFAAWGARYKLFSAVHTVASIYPAYYKYKTMPLRNRMRLRFTDTLLGWLAARRIELCYANTPDAAQIAWQFFGIPVRAVKIIPSGIDVAHLRPVSSLDDATMREQIRASLKVTADEMLCIYTGRLTDAKNPKCLADAIRILRVSGHKFRAIFFGEGEQAYDIAAVEGCRVLPFVKYEELPLYYRAADIGVWPRQESISMTDAAACGIPIVVSDRMLATERINGNGVSFRENDPTDLTRVLLNLSDPVMRARLGSCGAERMAAHFNIEKTAAEIIADFHRAHASLGSSTGRATDA